ncbi:MAG: hypothetical protein ACLFPL_03150 [Candidatus Nanoarchaeia archaeon]
MATKKIHKSRVLVSLDDHIVYILKKSNIKVSTLVNQLLSDYVDEKIIKRENNNSLVEGALKSGSFWNCGFKSHSWRSFHSLKSVIFTIVWSLILRSHIRKFSIF